MEKAPSLTSIAAAVRRSSPVPSHCLILVVQGQVTVARLVSLDEVRQDGAETGVIVAVDVLVGALHHLTWVRVADVARLAVVVPCSNLDKS